MFTVKTASQNAKISINKKEEGDITLLEIIYHTEECEIPQSFKICWDFFAKDCCSVFSPSARDFRSIGMDWNPKKTESRLASWMPLHCILARNGHNRLNITVSDVKTPIAVTTGINEHQGVYKCVVEFFAKSTRPIKEYKAEIRLDYRDIPYWESVYDSVSYVCE